MVTAGYTFDRFYLPDWPRSGHEAHTHRESPGAVVFRGRSLAGDGKLRVVLLVPETPTAGLNREALRNALTLVRTWDPHASEIRILGPKFSGSVDSLARVLREDLEILEPPPRPHHQRDRGDAEQPHGARGERRGVQG